MKVFADTSGLFALLVKNDDMYLRARENFTYFAENNVQLVTSSFVLVEITALYISLVQPYLPAQYPKNKES